MRRHLKKTYLLIVVPLILALCLGLAIPCAEAEDIIETPGRNVLPEYRDKKPKEKRPLPSETYNISLNGVTTLRLPPINLAPYLAEDEANKDDWSKPPRIGIVRPLDKINPWTHGDWFDLPDGKRLWLMKFHSPGAKAVRIRFGGFSLPEDGAKVFVYSPSDLRGYRRFTRKGPRENGHFWWAVAGDTVVVELLVEPNVGLYKFFILELTHVYRDMPRRKHPGPSGKSESLFQMPQPKVGTWSKGVTFSPGTGRSRPSGSK